MLKTIEKTGTRSRGNRVLCVTLGLIFSCMMVAGGTVAAFTDADEGVDHLPDLEAVNIWVFPPNPNFESELSVHAFVWNNSDVVVEGPIVVHIGIEGIDARERVIPILHPWEAVPVEAVFPPLEIGEYTAFVAVDPEEMIPEDNEENNRAFAPFHVGPPLLLPDLAVIDLKVFPREVTTEDDVTIEGMVWNDSELAIDGPIEVRMGLDGHLVGEPIIINGLFPREARRLSVVARPQEVGEHVAFMRVDPEDQIRERREENNHRLLLFEVMPPPPATVDIVPTGGTVLPPDGTLFFETMLENHTEEFLRFPFRVMITQPEPGSPWIFVDEFEVELEPGGVSIEEMEAPLPDDPPLLPGLYQLVGEAGDFDRDAFEFIVTPVGKVAQ